MSANPALAEGDDHPSGLAGRLVAALSEADAVVIEGGWPAASIAALRAEAEAADRAGALVAAAVGRGAAARRDDRVRGDRRAWIEDLGPAQFPALHRLLGDLDAIRRAVDRGLLLGTTGLEAQLACYPPGRGYARHLDRFADHDARVLSLVLYLNPDWDEADGGALRLHLPGGVRDVMPRAGTLLAFLSDRVEHEVLPPARPRWSIAAWFRNDR